MCGEPGYGKAAKVLIQGILGFMTLAHAWHGRELSESALGSIEEPQGGAGAALAEILSLLFEVAKGKIALDDAAIHPSRRSSGLRERIRSRSADQSLAVISLVGLCKPAQSAASRSCRLSRRCASRISSRRY